MAVTSVQAFRSEPGRTADHLALAAESLGHLRRLGLQAVNLQPVVGADIGTITGSIVFANNTDYASSMKKVRGDAQWQEFWAQASSSGAAVQVESSLFTDLDPNFQPNPGRPLGVVMATQWRARPGRLMDFLGHVATSIPHITRLGGLARPMQSIIGAHPMTVLVTTTFADIDAYGQYADKLAGDEQWNAFWASVMTDPTADLVRSGLYLNISGD